MHVAFPLLFRVFTYYAWVNASIVVIFDTNQIHVPNSNNKVSEFDVSFELSANELVILEEILKRYRPLILESIVCAVQSSEKIEKLEPSLFHSLQISYNFWVPSWLKL